eukprot:COSAG01_NODE_2459_length_7655_cov_138.985442_3_plen_276_part_00
MAGPLLRGAASSRPCCRAATAGGIARGGRDRGWRCPLRRGGGSTLGARALSVEAGDCCAPPAQHSTAARGGGGEAEKELEALRRSLAALQAENESLRAQHARMEGASSAAAPQGSFSHGCAGGWVAGRGQQRQDGCNVLSLDGGGVRGLFTAVILARLVEEEPRLMERFDLVAGTSSGGIIGSKPPASPRLALIGVQLTGGDRRSDRACLHAYVVWDLISPGCTLAGAAALLALGHAPSEVVDIFTQTAPQIFRHRGGLPHPARRASCFWLDVPF